VEWTDCEDQDLLSLSVDLMLVFLFAFRWLLVELIRSNWAELWKFIMFSTRRPIRNQHEAFNLNSEPTLPPQGQKVHYNSLLIKKELNILK